MDILEFIQNEFKTVHDSLDRIEDKLTRRLDDQDTRIIEVEKKAAAAKGAVGLLGVLATIMSVIIAFAHWFTNPRG